MFDLFNNDFNNDYEERVNLLQNNHVALWDVLSHCESSGSSDFAIKNEIPNDFKAFYKTYPNIKNVFFTSQKAEFFYNKYVGKHPGRNYFLLSSPSSANSWKTYDQKLEEWKIILRYLA